MFPMKLYVAIFVHCVVDVRGPANLIENVTVAEETD